MKRNSRLGSAALLARFGLTTIAALTLSAGSAGAAAPGKPAGTAAASRGREVFVRVGCSECHGTQGQGSSAGRRLAPDPLPLVALIPFVRAASGQMPSYAAVLVSDSELADIRAYLATIPAARPPQTLPALRDLRDSE